MDNARKGLKSKRGSDNATLKATGVCRGYAHTDLCVGQVVALIVVKRETQTALVLAQVIAHEVGVL